MTQERKVKFLVNVLFAAGVGAIAFFVFKYLLGWMLPFVLGLFLAFLLNPLIRLITNKGMPRKWAALVSMVTFYLIIVLIVWIVGSVLYSQTVELLRRLPSIYDNNVKPLLNDTNEALVSFLYRVSPETSVQIETTLSAVGAAFERMFSSLSSTTVGVITDIAKRIPMFLVTLIFTLIAAVLISMDYQPITGFLVRQMPDRIRAVFVDSKDYMIASLGRLLKAYAIIMLITFGELSLGLWLIGVEYFVVIAAIIAIFDILPAIGSGAFLIPWALISLFTGNTFQGVGLLALYLTITVIRNIIEPKIVGDQIGLHPLATLMAMYVGLKLGGVAGLVAAPLTILLIKYLNDHDYVQIYRK